MNEYPEKTHAQKILDFLDTIEFGADIDYLPPEERLYVKVCRLIDMTKSPPTPNEEQS